MKQASRIVKYIEITRLRCAKSSYQSWLERSGDHGWIGRFLARRCSPSLDSCCPTVRTATTTGCSPPPASRALSPPPRPRSSVGRTMDGQSSAAPAARSSMDASKNHTRNSHPHASASSSSTTSAASLAALLDEDEDTKAAAASPTRAAAAVGERMDSAATSPVDIHPKLAQRTVSATKTTDHPLAAAAPSSSKRDSFRHSFVLVPDEHPLMPKAQHATKSHPSALSIAESSGAGSGPLDEDEEQEAIIRRNQAAAAPSPDSLSGIIRAAIEEATDPAVLQAKQRMAAIQAADATFAAEAAAAAAAAAAASVPASSPSAVPSDPLPAPLPSPPAHAPRAAPNTTAISLGRLMKLLNFFMFR